MVRTTTNNKDETFDREDVRDRIVTQELTPEFLREFMQTEEIEERLNEAVRRFEDTYNAVAWYEEHNDYYGSEPAYRFRAIPARKADPDSIRRGIQEVHHWITNGYEA